MDSHSGTRSNTEIHIDEAIIPGTFKKKTTECRLADTWKSSEIFRNSTEKLHKCSKISKGIRKHSKIHFVHSRTCLENVLKILENLQTFSIGKSLEMLRMSSGLFQT